MNRDKIPVTHPQLIGQSRSGRLAATVVTTEPWIFECPILTGAKRQGSENDNDRPVKLGQTPTGDSGPLKLSDQLSNLTGLDMAITHSKI